MRYQIRDRVAITMKKRPAKEIIGLPLLLVVTVTLLVLYAEQPQGLEREVRKAQRHTDTQSTALRPQGPIDPIDCENYASVNPVHLSRMKSYPGFPYVVSFSWWDERLQSPGFGSNEVKSSGSVETIQRLLRDTEGAFLDSLRCFFAVRHGLA